jgi:glutaredoxin
MPLPTRTAWTLSALLAAAALPCAAQEYKVVQPDGSTTYTDRPPAGTAARVTPIGRTPGAAAAVAGRSDPGLPAELRLTAQRYPVTLYTAADCAPCDAGRRWLAQRGIPYRERRVVSQEDEAALVSLVGGRSVPSLTIGAQPVRGFAEGDWAAYLDAAGYPAESKLPRGWQPPPVTPLVEPPARTADTAPALTAPRLPPAARPAAPAPAAPASGTLRF